jgi:hypothetical protein
LPSPQKHRTGPFPRWLDERETVMLREVAPGLFLGAEGARKARTWDLVVDMFGSTIPVSTRYLIRWPMFDGTPVPRPLLDGVLPMVRGTLSRHDTVLVHCAAGLSRSASVAYGLLRRLYRLPHHEALRRVRVDTEAWGAIEDFPVPETLASVRTWAH